MTHQPRWRVGWRWLRASGAVLVAVVAVEYGVVPAVVQARSELSPVSDLSGWVLLGAGALEAASVAAYTALTQRLLAPHALRFGTQLRIDLTGYGLGHVLPGGGATSAAVRFRLMVARGVPEAAAASLTAVEAGLAWAGLVLVWALGSLLALPRTGSVTTVVLLAAVVVLAAVGGSWLSADRRRAVTRSLPGRLVERLPARVRAGAVATWGSLTARLRDLAALRAGLAWSTANWFLDAVCLWLCLRGYGARLAPELVLVSYGVTMIVAMLPLTPGGLGIVEGLLVPSLLAAGATAGAAVLGVLTWRLLQFWLPIPVGLVCWASLGGGDHADHDRHTPATTA